MKTFLRSFNGGELTPEFRGQVADIKYQTGLALCRNCIVLPHGPVQNRPGFEFVREVKNSAFPARLIPFEFSRDQTAVIELGGNYARFHSNGVTLLSGAAPYEVATPYTADTLFGLRYVQSADIVTLTSRSWVPGELRRYGTTNWTWTPITFASALVAPTGLVGSSSGSAGTQVTEVYAVTSVNDKTDESPLSSSVNITNAIFANDAWNQVAWVAAAGATRYNVYKRSNGLWGFIGQAIGVTFRDDNIAPDLGRSPPTGGNPFVASYPGAVTYYEQRRAFAGAPVAPQNVWLTRTGTESNMTYSIPGRDDDSVAFRIAARKASTVQHLVPLADLLALTTSAVFRITSRNADALTPSNVDAKAVVHVGAGDAAPAVVDSNVVYAGATGGHVYEVAYSLQGGGYVSTDLSLRAPHLFDHMTIVDVAFSRAPVPVVWCVSSSGVLLGLTYVPGQNVVAWHRHETDGAFESVAVVTEGDYDVLYAIVRRTIAGQSRRYVERLRPRNFRTIVDAFFVDCGVTRLAPGGVVAGLGHLEGKTVSILVDGAVHPQRVVAGGQVALEVADAQVVHIGLPIVAEGQTLPLVVETQGYGAGVTKNVGTVYLDVKDTSGVATGPTADALIEMKTRTTEVYGAPPNLVTGRVPIVNRGDWTDDGQVLFRQTDPLPMTIVSMTIEFAAE